MSDLADSNISVVNNVFVKQMVFVSAGQRAITHAHVYDHQMLLAAGSMTLIVDDIRRDYCAPAILLILAGKHHGIQALEDGTVAYCIHAMTNGETLDEADPIVVGAENRLIEEMPCPFG